MRFRPTRVVHVTTREQLDAALKSADQVIVEGDDSCFPTQPPGRRASQSGRSLSIPTVLDKRIKFLDKGISFAGIQGIVLFHKSPNEFYAIASLHGIARIFNRRPGFFPKSLAFLLELFLKLRRAHHAPPRYGFPDYRQAFS